MTVVAERTLRKRVLFGLGALVAFVAAAAYVWRDDIGRAMLDPQQPFQIYRPPTAPDYAQRTAWALLPSSPGEVALDDPPADVFFISPTTFDGGRHWNAPIADERSDRLFRRVMAPNYAGPFVRVGRLFAPRYRQASLYTLTTLREDAREARKFAYGDVAQAFRRFLADYNQGRPFLIIGVEQGGTLAARLIAEEVSSHPEVRARLAGAYMIEAVTPADAPPLPPCKGRREAGCLAAWVSVFENDLPGAQDLQNRSLVWAQGGDLGNLNGRKPLCFNPLLGATSDQQAPARLSLGAANATGLEWGARPAFLTRQISAVCRDGILRVSRPKSAMLRPSGSWADRQKEPAYNLFYADLEADAKARVVALSLRPLTASSDASRKAPATP